MPDPRNPIAVQFGRNLARARKQAGHSQEALAAKASVHRTEIGPLERGERIPRIDTAIKLASALGIEAHELVKDIEGLSGRNAQHEKAIKLTAEARKGRSEQTDAAGLIREVRDEMEDET